MTSPAGGGRTLFGINANGSLTSTDVNSTFYTFGTTGAGHAPTDMPSDIYLIYDQVRLAAVKIQWHPSLPNGAIQGAYLPGVITYDRDGITGSVQAKTFNDLLENVNGTKTFNMYRPFKRYIKFPKYKINTRIPSIEQQSTANNSLQANENLAGQWRACNFHLTTHNYGATSRGTHVSMYLPRNTGGSDEAAQSQGTLVLTTYWVFKDRT